MQITYLISILCVEKLIRSRGSPLQPNPKLHHHRHNGSPDYFVHKCSQHTHTHIHHSWAKSEFYVSSRNHSSGETKKAIQQLSQILSGSRTSSLACFMHLFGIMKQLKTCAKVLTFIWYQLYYNKPNEPLKDLKTKKQNKNKQTNKTN